jgi:2-acylglycerol O-acyltransferase 2
MLSASTSKTSPKNADGYTSNAVVLIVGGAQEAFFCKPANYQIILKKRKGFCKIALQTG